jgi:hypothetical protein
MSSFELQNSGWLLIFFTTTALSFPFIMVWRLFQVWLLKEDKEILEDEEYLVAWWLYFIYDKFAWWLNFIYHKLPPSMLEKMLEKSDCFGNKGI